jgi:hypothetical protein
MFLHASTAYKLNLSSFCITPFRHLHGLMATKRVAVDFVAANVEAAAFQTCILAAVVKQHTSFAMQL